MSDARTFYLSIISIILICCSAIFAIPQFIKFLQCVDININNPFFQARYSKVNLLYVSLFLFVLYILNPLSFILVTCNINKRIPIFVNDIGNNLVFVAFFTRAWVLCFDRYFIDTLKNWIWRREIDQKESETNLLIKYRDTLSSNRRLMITIIYIFCFCPIYVVFLLLSDSNIINHALYRIVYTIMLTILVLVTYYLICKISMVTDLYHVRRELLYGIKTTGLFYVTSHIVYLVVLFAIDSETAMQVEILILSFSNLCVIYVSCYWTRKKFISDSLSKLNNTPKERSRSFLAIFVKKQRILFDDVLNHKAGVEAFCRHLVNEFGLESILFLIEVCQFKAKVHQKYTKLTENIPDICNSVSDHVHLIFAVSTILNVDWMPMDERMKAYSPYKIALYLYDKYIESSADLCVNISSANRRELYHSFKHLAATFHADVDMNDNECEESVATSLFTLFDAVYKEIWNLIQTDSYIRFKSTQQCQRLIYILYPTQAKQALADSKSQHKLVASSSLHNCKMDQSKNTAIQMPVKINSVSPSSNSVQSQSPAAEALETEEKKTDCKRPRAASLSSHASDVFFSNHLQLRAQTLRHSAQIPTKVMKDQISNEILVTVSADIIKTAADFWRENVNTLSDSDTVEVGMTIYLSLMVVDRSIKNLFKKHHRIKQKEIEMLSLKLLNMISWLIQTLWERNNSQLYPTLTKLGLVHKKMNIKVNHFNAMLKVLDETLKFYFPTTYRLQEKYCFAYIFAYAAEIMMNEPLSTKQKSKTYFKTLELKFNSEKKLNDRVRQSNNKLKLEKQYYGKSLPTQTSKKKDILTLTNSASLSTSLIH